MATENEKQLLVESIKENPLDPIRWQALGKALGWKRLKEVTTVKDALIFRCGGCGQECGGQEEWLYWAHAYFGLKMTGEDEEKFWKELLTPIP